MRVTELILRTVICGLGLAAALLVATDTQVKQILSIQKRAKFTDMKSLVFLAVANGIAAACSLVQILRCVVTGGSVVLNKPLAWLIFSADQVMGYVMVAAIAAAGQSAVFAKVGEAEVEWMAICDTYGKFCNQVGQGMATSVVSLRKHAHCLCYICI
ncbi:CASP-like protein 2B1 [Bidens hawaiensis]|uniref:CASP-like protein 2B1 n=1 Tax=Bidens hawaiensis TaxID=980011 RepID=UPI00404A6674